jgi:hypothetical protein
VSTEQEEPTVPDGDVPKVAPRQRQCGRCGVFSVAPDVDPGDLSDWWACAPCRAALFPSSVQPPR